MKQIKASEIKPGMTIRWERLEVKTELTVREVSYFNTVLYRVHSPQGMPVFIPSDAEVTVLAEAQPEEPTEFGAKVVVGMQRFLRAPLHASDSTPWLSQLDARWRSWPTILAMGPVRVVPDQGWTVPDDTPEVPDRIEEWPEDDTALRPYKWMDEYGEIWRHGSNSHVEGWTSGYLFQNRPVYGPWDRVTDGTPEVPERIEEWPEDDSHLREQRWRDREGAVWSSRDGQWGYSFTMGWVGLVANQHPFDGPWDRVTGA